MTPEGLNENLESAVSERPLLAHALDMRVVTRAVAIAAVVAIVLWVIAGPALAAIGLLLAYFGGWFVLARLSYDRRRESRPAETDGDADSDTGADS
jgi:hypothetical protein